MQKERKEETKRNETKERSKETRRGTELDVEQMK